ncbi:MAG: ABC transporter permease subunit [Pirellulaceae bacterium]
MFSTDLLLAQSTPGPSTWLTPIWLVSVGVLAGVVGSAIVVGLFWLLSRVSFIGNLYEDKTARYRVSLGIGAVVLVVLTALIVVPQWRATQAAEGSGAALTSTAVMLLAFIPGSAAIGFGIVALASRRAMGSLTESISEGALYWFGAVFIGLSVFAITGFVLGMMDLPSVQFVRAPDRKLESILRLQYAKSAEPVEFEIPADNGTGTAIDVSIDSKELKLLQFFSDQRIEMAAEPIENDLDTSRIFPIAESDGKEPVNYYHFSTYDNSPITEGTIKQLYFRNLGDGLHVRMLVTTQPEYPEVAIIPQTAFWVLAVILIYLMQRTALPQISAIALSTFKTETAQPVYSLFLILGTLFAVASIFIPYYTFDEDIKMLKDAVLTVMLVASIFMAVWAASKSIAEEIEGRTSLTVLSKPIGRRDFIIGKFLGVVWSTGLLSRGSDRRLPGRRVVQAGLRQCERRKPRKCFGNNASLKWRASFRLSSWPSWKWSCSSPLAWRSRLDCPSWPISCSASRSTCWAT